MFLGRVRPNEIRKRLLERANGVLRPNKSRTMLGRKKQSRPMIGRRKPERLKKGRWVIWEDKSRSLKSQGLGREVSDAYVLKSLKLVTVDCYAALSYAVDLSREKL